MSNISIYYQLLRNTDAQDLWNQNLHVDKDCQVTCSILKYEKNWFRIAPREKTGNGKPIKSSLQKYNQ